ncbi:MAG TPA: penicillin-binding protein 2 [Flavobacteriales bacterium]|nr:penicillin-binding protein 2 [Flavobacteriales bacterium]
MNNRKYIIGFSMAFLGLIFIVRLFYIQVYTDKYKLDSRNNVLRYITDYPARGLVYDRKGRLLVYNQAAYDLMIIPKQTLPMDTDEFLNLISLPKKDFIERYNKARKYSSRKPTVLVSDLSAEDYGKLQEVLFKFPGYYTQPKTLRKYPLKSASHLLGYISEVDQQIIDQQPYYKMGDHIGRSGIEKQYEEVIRGRRGRRIILVDVFNREKGKFEDGAYDTLAVSGKDIYLSIDAQLQQYGEQLMKNKKGAIVAIEPKTGEILAIVSKPDYDPNMLVGRIRTKNFERLKADTLKPLFNRALMASYPPGSTFKLINALVGLQEKVLTPDTKYTCYSGYNSGRFHMGCHSHASPINLEFSIQTSCNSYYSNVFRSIIDKYPTAEQGFNVWKNYVNSFGLGSKLNIDLPGELGGFVPSQSYYDRYYQKGKWGSLTVVSLAIGQGELGITPLQMANISAIIANRGYYYTPHLEKSGFHQNIQKNETGIDTANFNLVVSAMEKVVENGTGRAARKEGIAICGKTGTVENPHGEDHSTFLAFAPKDDPKIAISVYVENGVWGARWAAPIAGLMIEKYLRDSISDPALEERMINGNLINPDEE